MNKIKALLSVLFILTLSSCSDEFDPIPFSSNLDLPTEYTYELRISCYCFPSYVGPHRLHVKGDEIIGYELAVDDVEIDDQVDLEQFTIDALSKRVDEILEQDPFSQDVEVHPDYNFPVSVYIDIDERIADEEWGYEISDFEVIVD